MPRKCRSRANSNPCMHLRMQADETQEKQARPEQAAPGSKGHWAARSTERALVGAQVVVGDPECCEDEAGHVC